jgi:hypothetical protein
VPDLTHHALFALSRLPAVGSLQPQGKVLESGCKPELVAGLRFAGHLDEVERRVENGS